MKQEQPKTLSNFSNCEVLKEGKYFTLYFDKTIMGAKPYMIVHKEHGTVAEETSNVITATVQFDTMEMMGEALFRVEAEKTDNVGNTLQ